MNVLKPNNYAKGIKKFATNQLKMVGQFQKAHLFGFMRLRPLPNKAHNSNKNWNRNLKFTIF